MHTSGADHSYSGFCARCQCLHTLPMAGAKSAARELIAQLDRTKRLDFHLPEDQADPRFSTNYLFGEARGKMFGVMVCQRADGSELILKSFSGQYNSQWALHGWAPPLFDLQQWHRVNDGAERKITEMGSVIAALGVDSPQGKDLLKIRAERSRDLMKALHRLYTLHNFRSQSGQLTQIYTGNSGIPNGTADCCGPKLLDFAARSKLRPLGLAEFYYGRPNRKGNRRHGRFYPACHDKCAPVLGYMLCGLSPPSQS